MPRPVKNLPLEYKQSNLITSAIFKFSLQEQRIKAKIVSLAAEFRQKNQHLFCEGQGVIYRADDHQRFVLPIREFMTEEQKESEGGSQYKEIENSFESMINKMVRIKTDNYWSYGGFIVSAERIGETIKFDINKHVWNCALDYSQGYTSLQLETIFKLSSAYSIVFYENIKSFKDTHIWNITVEELRELLGCEKKYPAVKDFKTYIIDQVRKELDEKSPITFTYTQHKKGSRVTSFSFFIKSNFNNPSDDSFTIDTVLSPEVFSFLHRVLKMSQEQIANNMDTILTFQEYYKMEALSELNEIYSYLQLIQKEPQENLGMFIDLLKQKVKWKLAKTVK